ncbi:3-isopropylmalate dehydrogenase [Halococcus morrhuae DSM 1307]|uniref:3-isopropylmalate dehydrogenase n=2 Tax=Halococcus TaxID=2249 RepID=M0M4X7_HALMO|nr:MULTISPECIES: isocitrate/isopropylmalate family dehydrogenase [Halococcus]EMA40751.1 3-isopropylmalate dehydrogenase [Halococcus morrhuae DSM 1307]UOO96339.1 isocitrate/isopropylmalate family dehydrogenase [Halococcus dombrowskii]
METYDIAVIPGDGIGTEVTSAAMEVLDTVAENHDFQLERSTYDWGTERYLDEGAMMPDDGLDRIESADSIFLGAVGHPEVPDHVTLNGLLLPIRKGFDQYICKRPNKLFEGIESPLRGYGAGDIDLVVYRENTEGEYANVGGREHRGFSNEVAVQSGLFTRKGTERIVRSAFEAATEREGHLTSITKSNAQAHSMVFWDDIVKEVSEDFPEVEVSSLLVDRASMDLVRRPEEFDVVVASNLFGDISTDIAAIITGSLGLAPSGNINEENDYPDMFEPVHGSAPDIVGQGIANPLASVLTGAMMFEYLGDGKEAAADDIWNAVEAQLADESAPRTPDLGGDAKTVDVVSDLSDRL